MKSRKELIIIAYTILLKHNFIKLLGIKEYCKKTKRIVTKDEILKDKQIIKKINKLKLKSNKKKEKK